MKKQVIFAAIVASVLTHQSLKASEDDETPSSSWENILPPKEQGFESKDCRSGNTEYYCSSSGGKHSYAKGGKRKKRKNFPSEQKQNTSTPLYTPNKETILKEAQKLADANPQELLVYLLKQNLEFNEFIGILKSSIGFEQEKPAQHYEKFIDTLLNAGMYCHKEIQEWEARKADHMACMESLSPEDQELYSQQHTDPLQEKIRRYNSYRISYQGMIPELISKVLSLWNTPGASRFDLMHFAKSFDEKTRALAWAKVLGNKENFEAVMADTLHKVLSGVTNWDLACDIIEKYTSINKDLIPSILGNSDSDKIFQGADARRILGKFTTLTSWTTPGATREDFADLVKDISDKEAPLSWAQIKGNKEKFEKIRADVSHDVLSGLHSWDEISVTIENYVLVQGLDLIDDLFGKDASSSVVGENARKALENYIALSHWVEPNATRDHLIGLIDNPIDKRLALAWGQLEGSREKFELIRKGSSHDILGGLTDWENIQISIENYTRIEEAKLLDTLLGENPPVSGSQARTALRDYLSLENLNTTGATRQDLLKLVSSSQDKRAALAWARLEGNKEKFEAVMSDSHSILLSLKSWSDIKDTIENYSKISSSFVPLILGDLDEFSLPSDALRHFVLLESWETSSANREKLLTGISSHQDRRRALAWAQLEGSREKFEAVRKDLLESLTKWADIAETIENYAAVMPLNFINDLSGETARKALKNYSALKKNWPLCDQMLSLLSSANDKSAALEWAQLAENKTKFETVFQDQDHDVLSGLGNWQLILQTMDQYMSLLPEIDLFLGAKGSVARDMMTDYITLAHWNTPLATRSDLIKMLTSIADKKSALAWAKIPGNKEKFQILAADVPHKILSGLTQWEDIVGTIEQYTKIVATPGLIDSLLGIQGGQGLTIGTQARQVIAQYLNLSSWTTLGATRDNLLQRVSTVIEKQATLKWAQGNESKLKFESTVKDTTHDLFSGVATWAQNQEVIENYFLVNNAGHIQNTLDTSVDEILKGAPAREALKKYAGLYQWTNFLPAMSKIDAAHKAQALLYFEVAKKRAAYDLIATDLTHWPAIKEAIDSYINAGDEADKIIRFSQSLAFKRVMLMGYLADVNKSLFNQSYPILADLTQETSWGVTIGKVLKEYKQPLSPSLFQELTGHDKRAALSFEQTPAYKEKLKIVSEDTLHNVLGELNDWSSIETVIHNYSLAHTNGKILTLLGASPSILTGKDARTSLSNYVKLLSWGEQTLGLLLSNLASTQDKSLAMIYFNDTTSGAIRKKAYEAIALDLSHWETIAQNIENYIDLSMSGWTNFLDMIQKIDTLPQRRLALEYFKNQDHRTAYDLTATNLTHWDDIHTTIESYLLLESVTGLFEKLETILEKKEALRYFTDLDLGEQRIQIYKDIAHDLRPLSKICEVIDLYISLLEKEWGNFNVMLDKIETLDQKREALYYFSNPKHIKTYDRVAYPLKSLETIKKTIDSYLNLDQNWNDFRLMMKKLNSVSDQFVAIEYFSSPQLGHRRQEGFSLIARELESWPKIYQAINHYTQAGENAPLVISLATKISAKRAMLEGYAADPHKELFREVYEGAMKDLHKETSWGQTAGKILQNYHLLLGLYGNIRFESTPEEERIKLEQMSNIATTSHFDLNFEDLSAKRIENFENSISHFLLTSWINIHLNPMDMGQAENLATVIANIQTLRSLHCTFKASSMGITSFKKFLSTLFEIHHLETLKLSVDLSDMGIGEEDIEILRNMMASYKGKSLSLKINFDGNTVLLPHFNT